MATSPRSDPKTCPAKATGSPGARTATAAIATAKTKFRERCQVRLISRRPSRPALPPPARVADALARSSIRVNVQAHSAVAHLAERQPASGSASLVVRDDQRERPLVGRRRLLCHLDANELVRPSRVPDKGRRPAPAPRRASPSSYPSPAFMATRLVVTGGAEGSGRQPVATIPVDCGVRMATVTAKTLRTPLMRRRLTREHSGWAPARAAAAAVQLWIPSEIALWAAGPTGSGLSTPRGSALGRAPSELADWGSVRTRWEMPRSPDLACL